jgi:hypothetical protein
LLDIWANKRLAEARNHAEFKVKSKIQSFSMFNFSFFHAPLALSKGHTVLKVFLASQAARKRIAHDTLFLGALLDAQLHGQACIRRPV